MKESGYFPGTDQAAEGSAVFIDNKTGGVRAAVGGRDYVTKGYNRVTAKRQPGSTFKPIAVYGAPCRKTSSNRIRFSKTN